MSTLQIQNLHVEIDGKEILKEDLGQVLSAGCQFPHHDAGHLGVIVKCFCKGLDVGPHLVLGLPGTLDTV